MFINSKNLIKAAMDGNPFRGLPGYVNTASAQLSVIDGLFDSYIARGIEADRDAAMRYLLAATESIFEKRGVNTDSPALATAVTVDDTAAEVVEYTTGTSVGGLVTFSGTARQVLRVTSTDAVLKWRHPFADLTSGEDYTIFEYVAVGGETTVRIQQPVTGPVNVIYARQSAVTLPENIEATTWGAFTQVRSIDTWTHSGLIALADRVLRKANSVTGDPQWAQLADNLFNDVENAAAPLRRIQWFGRTWADEPLVAAGQSKITDRVPDPEYAVDKTGALVISAPAQAAGTHVGARFDIKPYTFTTQTTIVVNVWANVEVDAEIRVYDQYGQWYFAALTVGSDAASQQYIGAEQFTLSGVPGESIPNDPQVAVEIRFTSTGYFVAHIGDIYVDGSVYNETTAGYPYQRRIRSGQSAWQGPVVIADQPRRDTPPGLEDLIRNAFDLFSFKTVYYPDLIDAITYGPPGTYGYRAPVTYNNNGDQQYRILQMLSHIDADSRFQLSTEVAAMYNWLMDPQTWHYMWPAFLNSWDDSIMRAAALDATPQTVTTYPPYGPPTDYYLNQTPSIEYADPAMAAQILSVIVDVDYIGRAIAGQTGENPYVMQTKAMLHKVIAALDVMFVESGQMAGTFSPRPDQQVWYGAWHGEITAALAKAHRWAQPDIRAMPMLVERCDKWLNGLTAFLLRQTAQEDIFMAPVPWAAEPNWRSQYVETYLFSTKIVTARSGKEQRISTRVRPRRRMSYNTVEHGADAANTQALLQAYQNRPIMFPEWRLSTVTGVVIRAGAETATLANPPADEVKAGGRIIIKDGATSEAVAVSYRAGSALYFATPLQNTYSQYAEVTPVSLGAMFAGQTASQVTATAATRIVNYEVLPQYDAITLPDIDADTFFDNYVDLGGPLELVNRSNNWRVSADIANDWTFDSISKDDGPILFYTGEDAARMTFGRTWTLFNREQIRQALGFIARTNGSQKPFWWPTLVRDLDMAQDQEGGNTLNVRACTLTGSGVLLSSFAAIAVVRPDGSIYPAGVLAANAVAGGVVVLQLDRDILVGDTIKQSDMVCMVLRVRMTGDAVAVNYITPDKAEIKLSMTTVQEA